MTNTIGKALERTREWKLLNTTTMPNDQPLQVRLYKTWDELSGLSSSWDSLLAQSAVSTPFLTYEWLEAWWIAYREAREPFVLGFLGPENELIGIAPLYRTSCPEHTKTKLPVRMLRFLGTGTGGTSTSLGLIMRHGYETVGAHQLLDWLLRSRAEWDILDLHLLPTEWLSTSALLNELTHRGWFCLREQETHLRISLPDKYSAYLASLSKKMRTELPYEQRRLQKQFRVVVNKLRTEAELRPALDTLFRLNSQRWQARGQGGSFGTAERRVFCQEMARRFFLRHWLDLWLLELDGRIAAMEYGFRYGGVYYPLWVALDTEFQAFSAGAVLRAYIIQQLINDGIQVYEFMQGDEPYKRRWGPEGFTYTSLRCATPRSFGAMYLRMSAWNSAARLRLTSVRERCKVGLRSALAADIRSVVHNVRSHMRPRQEVG